MPKVQKEWLEILEGETLQARGTTGRASALRIAGITTLSTTAIYGVLGSLVGLFSWYLVPVFAAIFFTCTALFTLSIRHHNDWGLTDKALYLRKGLRFPNETITEAKPVRHGVLVTLGKGSAQAKQRLESDTPDALIALIGAPHE